LLVFGNNSFPLLDHFPKKYKGITLNWFSIQTCHNFGSLFLTSSNSSIIISIIAYTINVDPSQITILSIYSIENFSKSFFHCKECGKKNKKICCFQCMFCGNVEDNNDNNKIN
jgi:hypothetical protein